jgi:hypothetical protein
MNAPVLSVILPPVKRLICCMAHAEPGRSATGLRNLGICKSRLQHDRKRRPLPIPTAESVAAEFEAAAKGRQFEYRQWV